MLHPRRPIRMVPRPLPDPDPRTILTVPMRLVEQHGELCPVFWVYGSQAHIYSDVFRALESKLNSTIMT